MRQRFLHKLILIGIFVSGCTYAQILNIDEESNLRFQTHFFDALKQNAIQNYSRAIESLEKCYAIEASNKAVLFEFSKNYFELKKYFEAETFIDKALEIDQQDKYMLAFKVKILKSLQRFSEAIEIQEQFVKKYPSNSDDLVQLYIQNNNLVKARELISKIEKNGLTSSKTKAYKKYLDNINIRRNNEFSDKASPNNNDLTSLKKQYKSNKEFILLRKILSKEKEGRLYDQLYNDSKEGLELFPVQPFLYLMNGLALNKLKKYKEAIKVLKTGIEFVVEDKKTEADFLEQLSVSFIGLKNNEEALRYKKKAQELRQGN